MVKCPVCNAEVSSTDKRCKKCGTPINNKKLNFTSSKLILGIIVVIIILAIVGAFASGIFTNSDSSPANDGSSDKIVEPITEKDLSDNDSQPNESTPTEYWASAKTDKFHLPECEWAEKISEDNKIIYSSREDALADGKEPCGVCNP